MFNGEFRWFESFRKTFEENLKPSLNGHSVQYFAFIWNKGLENLSNFIDLCNPIILDIENQKSDSEIKNFLGFTKSVNGTLPYQLYCAHKVFCLLQNFQEKNNRTFDLYIRMRPDLVFLNKINFDVFDSESVYFKQSHSGTKTSTYLNDYMYLSRNYDAVRKMAQFGSCLDETLKNTSSLAYREFISQDIYCPEELLARHVSNKSISAKLHNFDIDLARHHKNI